MASKSTQPKNVIIIGHSGMGKSSLINMLRHPLSVGDSPARCSNDTVGCTREEKAYECNLPRPNGQPYKVMVHDTVGLEEERWGFLPASAAKKRLKKYLKSYVKENKLHLLLYCMSGQRGGQKKAQAKNYKEFKSVVGNVPVVLVITKLDLLNYTTGSAFLDDWWSSKGNQRVLQELGMESADHICVISFPKDNSNGTIFDDCQARCSDIQMLPKSSPLRPHRVFERHADWVSSLAFSPDETHIATGSGDGTVLIWNLQTGAHTDIGGHTGFIRSVSFSPDGQRIATGGYDGRVCIWDISSRTLLFALSAEHDSRAVSFSPDGHQVASVGDGSVKIWDTTTSSTSHSLNDRGHWTLAYTPDGSMLAC
ncbi:hypothetical protein AZE42_12532, partial [Rhizopogon vesiculosus]